MCSRDDDNYIGSGSILKHAIAKYGKKNFERKILAETENYDELLHLERHYINKFNAVESDEYYNLCVGGLGGNSDIMKQYWASFSDEERKNVRNWNGHFMHAKFDRYDDPEWRKHVSDGVKKSWEKLTKEERKERSEKSAKTLKEKGSVAGEKNGMFGRSAVKEKNLKWYTNGKDNVYVTEGTQPEGFQRGRTMHKVKNKC